MTRQASTNKPEEQWQQLMNIAVWSLILLVMIAAGIIVAMVLFRDSAHRNEDPKPLANRQPLQEIASATDVNEVDANGIHVLSGLKFGPGIEVVQSQCLSCHSSKLITQNRATRDGWEEMIRWMQATQGLGPLGTQEPVILDYLATFYAPENEHRRPILEVNEIEWYILNTD